MKHTKWSLYVFSNFMYLIQYSQIHSFACFPYSSGKGEKYQASISYFPNWILSTNLILVILRKTKQTVTTRLHNWQWHATIQHVLLFINHTFTALLIKFWRNTYISFSEQHIKHWVFRNNTFILFKSQIFHKQPLKFTVQETGFVFFKVPAHQN